MSVTSEEDSAAREVTGSYFTDPQAGEVSFTKMDPFSALTGSLFGKPRGLTSKKGQTTQTVQSTAEGVIVVTRSFTPVAQTGPALRNEAGSSLQNPRDDAGLGYIGDHVRHEPEQQRAISPCAVGYALSSSQPHAVRTSQTLALSTEGDLKPSPSHANLSPTVLNTTFVSPAPSQRQACDADLTPSQGGNLSDYGRLINFIKLWSPVVPPWLYNEAVPLDFKRVKDYCVRMGIPIPPSLESAVAAQIGQSTRPHSPSGGAEKDGTGMSVGNYDYSVVQADVAKRPLHSSFGERRLTKVKHDGAKYWVCADIQPSYQSCVSASAYVADTHTQGVNDNRAHGSNYARAQVVDDTRAERGYVIDASTRFAAGADGVQNNRPVPSTTEAVQLGSATIVDPVQLAPDSSTLPCSQPARSGCSAEQAAQHKVADVSAVAIDAILQRLLAIEQRLATQSLPTASVAAAVNGAPPRHLQQVAPATSAVHVSGLSPSTDLHPSNAAVASSNTITDATSSDVNQPMAGAPSPAEDPACSGRKDVTHAHNINIFCPFDANDPDGSLKILQQEFDMRNITDRIKKLDILIALVGSRTWKRYLSLYPHTEDKFDGFCSYLRARLSQSHTCLQPGSLASTEDLEDLMADLNHCEKEVFKKHFLLQHLEPEERAYMAMYMTEPLDECVNRAVNLIRNRPSTNQYRGGRYSLRPSYRNTTHADNDGSRRAGLRASANRDFAPMRNAGRSIPRSNTSHNAGTAHVCFYHKRYGDRAYSCEGHPCSKFANQRLVQPLSPTTGTTTPPPVVSTSSPVATSAVPGN